MNEESTIAMFVFLSHKRSLSFPFQLPVEENVLTILLYNLFSLCIFSRRSRYFLSAQFLMLYLIVIHLCRCGTTIKGGIDCFAN